MTTMESKPRSLPRWLRRLTIAAAAIALAVVAATAHATYPGTNGRLAFGSTVNGNTDVYSVLPNGEGLKRLTDDPGADICPSYSPDGEWIAWCAATGTWVMRQDGSEKRQLTNFGTFPDISPDGTKVVFNGAPSGSTNPDVWLVKFDGTGLTRLTSAPGPDNFAVWSPDGTRIAFQSVRSGISQVWLMNADGSGQRQLTFDPVPKDQVPDWSPDGSRLAFVEKTQATGGDIWIMNADGSDAHPLTARGDFLGTAWSPDGSSIATLDWPTRTVEIVSVREGDERTRGNRARSTYGEAHVVHAGGVQFVPGWQPRR